MDGIPDDAFRMHWRRTWPEVEDDFVARRGKSFCRIYRTLGGPNNDRWFWTCATETRKGGTGHEDTPREAALAAEVAYFAVGGISNKDSPSSDP